MIRFVKPEQADAYRACLQEGVGYIANCCSGWPQGYVLHHVSCHTLHNNQFRDPTEAHTGKLWAMTADELDVNYKKAYGVVLERCNKCFMKTESPVGYDSDIKRESRLVVPGGQVESNRSRH
jgi:hypothetical protein